MATRGGLEPQALGPALFSRQAPHLADSRAINQNKNAFLNIHLAVAP